ncbi:hypothetical protein KJ785_02265, partial [Patescibacteria group bacterium]|nr:hypothetical protein [Patescibacteria group bacterium]
DYFLNLSTIDLSGFGIYYQLFLGLGSIFYTLLGSVFLFKALKMFFSVRSSWLAVIIVIFCSPLLHYIIYEPFMSHGVSFFAVSLLFWYSINFWETKEINNKNLIVLGALIGLVVLVRWQNIIFALLPLLICLKKVSDKKLEVKKNIITNTNNDFSFFATVVNVEILIRKFFSGTTGIWLYTTFSSQNFGSIIFWLPRSV